MSMAVKHENKTLMWAEENKTHNCGQFADLGTLRLPFLLQLDDPDPLIWTVGGPGGSLMWAACGLWDASSPFPFATR